MENIWATLFEECRHGLSFENARRATNVLMAAALATQCLTERDVRSRWMRIIDDLEATDLLHHHLDWSRIERALNGLPTSPLRPSTFDAWVETFQASDPKRKTAGAYATPSVFADVIAEGAIAQLGATVPRIIDPAVGAGNLLLAAFRRLRDLGCPTADAAYALFGVELDPAARELCILQIWLSAGGAAELRRISANIALDNALTRDWWDDDLFDVLLMNPPWESLRPQKGQSWDEVRLATIRRLDSLASGAPGLPPLYSAHGRGDRNLFKAFVELAPHLLRPDGRIGALVPAAFGSDLGMADLRKRYLAQFELDRWTSYENRQKHFAIDSRYKFGLLFGTRNDAGTSCLDVMAFCDAPEHVNAPHVKLDRRSIARIGGAGMMIPELTSKAEGDVLLRMLERGSSLFEKGPFGRIRYQREIDLTLGKRGGAFWRVDEPAPHYGLKGLSTGSVVPLLEGRMVGQYDCFQKSYVSGLGREATWIGNDERSVASCRPQYVCEERSPCYTRVALCDVTSATNTRTVLATLVPPAWRCGNTAPVLNFESIELAHAGLAVLNSMIFDWMARRLVGGLHLNKFYLERFAWPQLATEAVEQLSLLGVEIAAASPRGAAPKGRIARLNEFDRVSALAAVEVIVARGFGLSANDVALILSADSADRRGLWRYFAAEPNALDVARATLKTLDGAPGPGPSRLAA